MVIRLRLQEVFGQTLQVGNVFWLSVSFGGLQLQFLLPLLQSSDSLSYSQSVPSWVQVRLVLFLLHLFSIFDINKLQMNFQFLTTSVSLFQGVAMPAMNNLLSKWVPVAERSRSLALVYSGMYLGSVTGLAFSPFLIHSYGWPSVFFSFGSLGTVWTALWLSKVFFQIPSLSYFCNDGS